MKNAKNRLHDRRFFYKYTSVDTAYINLTTNTIRLSSPLILNDPFDCVRELKIPIDYSETPKLLINRFKYLLMNMKPNIQIKNETINFALDYFKKIDKEDQDLILESLPGENSFYEIIRTLDFSEIQQTWTNILPKLRLLSLAEEYDNPVMWNSYSEKYTGVVLELECLDEADSLLLLAEPVKYSDEEIFLGSKEYWIDLLIGVENFNFQETFHALEINKKAKWAYEREWRVLSFEKKSAKLFTDYTLPENTFTKVLFGKDVTKCDKDKLLNLKNSRSIKSLEYYDMSINHYDRQFEFNLIT